MAKIKINRVVNANVYLDGDSFLGRCEEVTAPDVKVKMADHKGLGMYGTLELPAGVDKIEAKFKWASIYPEVAAKVADPFKVVAVQVRGSIAVYNAQGRESEKPCVAHFRGVFKNLALGSYKQHDNVETSSDMTVYYAKWTVDGVDVIEVDVLENILKVNGVDALADYRANIGG